MDSKNYLQLSRYHLGVVLLYVVICPLIFFVSPLPLSFGFNSSDILLTIAMLAGMLIGFYILNPVIHFGKIALQPHRPTAILWVLIYSTILIALPEEIIFRGIIQNLIHDKISNILLVVLLSAGIFGLAHVFNRAQGIHPKSWNWNLSGAAFIVGIFLGIAFAVTQSLAVPIILHAAVLICLKLFMKETRQR